MKLNYFGPIEDKKVITTALQTISSKMEVDLTGNDRFDLTIEVGYDSANQAFTEYYNYGFE